MRSSIPLTLRPACGKRRSRPEAAIVNVSAEIETTGAFINLAGIDLVSMRLVVHCAELGSLSAAARQGNMSLSCASHRLSNLEGFFRTRFFQRDYRGLQLMHAGKVFVTHANSVLHALHLLSNQLASLPVRDVQTPVEINFENYKKSELEGLKNSEYQITP